MQNFKRVLLKLSGEGLSSGGGMLDFGKIKKLSNQIKQVLNKGIEVAVVVGGGNVCRGVNHECSEYNRLTLDNMGILATIINGLALLDIFKQNGVPCVLASALEINKITEFYNVDKVNYYLEQKKVVILVAGIANPYFSTDTTAVIRASELQCDAVFKGTQVNGVFDKDPKYNKDAKKIDKVSYDEVIRKNLMVMDMQSIIIAKSSNMPIYIFNMHNDDCIVNLTSGNLEYSVIN